MSAPDPLQLGQHFLKDDAIIERMVEAADLHDEDVVFEPGFGRGSITRRLARHCDVIAAEIDPTLTLALERVEVVHANALDLIRTRAFTAVVANPPFTMLEPLIKRIFPKHACTRLVLVMPRSFAGLLQGERKLGVLARAAFTVDEVCAVPSSAFYPAPDTDCVALRLLRRPEEGKSPAERALCELASQQDKKIKNALERFYEGTYTKRQVRERLAGLDAVVGKGVMALTEDEFTRLCAVIASP